MSPTTARSLILLAVVAGTFFIWLRIQSPKRELFKYLGYLLYAALPMEIVGTITSYFGATNTGLYNVFQLAEFFLLLAIIRTMLGKRQWLLIPALVVGIGGFVWSYWVNGGMDSALLIESVLVFAMVITFFSLGILWDLAQNSDTAIHKLPEFWVFIGLMIYFGGITPIIAAIGFIYRDNRILANQLWVIVPVLAILRYLLTAIACNMEQRIKKI